MAQQILSRRDSVANWASVNPILAKGEWGVAYDGDLVAAIKMGDGVTQWNSLPDLLSDGGGGGGISLPIEQSDVIGLVAALAGKANSSHTHAQSDVTGLSAALAGKANSSHTHAQSDVTGLVAALAGKAAASHEHEMADLDIFPSSATGLFLRDDGTWAEPAGGGGGTSDHGSLTGLSDDDHPQYALADGTRGNFAASNHTHAANTLTGIGGTPTGSKYLRDDFTWQTVPGGGGGGGGGAIGLIYVLSSDAPAEHKALASDYVLVCDGTNDQEEINTAIQRAAPLYSRNTRSGVNGVSTQLGTVKLSGGRFNISGSTGIQMRTGVRLEGSGWLTEIRSVGCTATGLINMVASGEHVFHVSNLWLNGGSNSGDPGGATGASDPCHGIYIDGRGSTDNFGPQGTKNYPNSGPDQYNLYTDLYISDFEGSNLNRKGIYLLGQSGSNDRGWIIDRVQIRRINGVGIHVEDSTDGYISNTHVGTIAYDSFESRSLASTSSRGTGYYISAANVKMVNNKAFYCANWGMVSDNWQGICTGFEAQENVRGVRITGRAGNFSGLLLDGCLEDGVLIDATGSNSPHGTVITGLTCINVAPVWNDEGLAPARGIRLAGEVYEAVVIGLVDTYSGAYPIQQKVSGEWGPGCFVRLTGETGGTSKVDGVGDID